MTPTLAAALQGTNNATPGIHDALSERYHVVVHLVAALGGGYDGGGLGKYLGDDRKVRLEVATNRAGNVPEALKNGGLELVGQGGALWVHVSLFIKTAP